MTIKEVIDKWDPIGLFPGAPDNEYHSEIQVIEEMLLQTKVHVLKNTRQQLCNSTLRRFPVVHLRLLHIITR
jgi:hypothetical protein